MKKRKSFLYNKHIIIKKEYKKYKKIYRYILINNKLFKSKMNNRFRFILYKCYGNDNYRQISLYKKYKCFNF